MKYLTIVALCLFAGCGVTPATRPALPTLPPSTVLPAGRARMFIDIGLQVAPERQVDEANTQRSVINGWQREILARLAGHFDPVTATQYRTLPALVLDLDHDGLSALEGLIKEYAETPGHPPLRAARDASMRPHALPPMPMEEALSLTRVDALRPELLGTGQVVVVIDDGVSEAFDMTAGKVVAGGFITSGEPHPCHSSTSKVKMCFEDKADGYPLTSSALPNHGTQVAAIACGTLGVAPAAKCFAIRVADSTGKILFGDALEALEVFYVDWVATYPGATVNLSLGLAKQLFESVGSCGTSIYSSTAKLACQNLAAKNCPVVVSAGNDGAADATAFPACLSEVITVGATTKTILRPFIERSPFSNWGHLVDITAPGVNLLVPMGGAVYGFSPGTSVAAPQVAGVLMLLREAHGTCDLSDLRQALLESPSLAGEELLPFLNARSALDTLDILCPHP